MDKITKLLVKSTFVTTALASPMMAFAQTADYSTTSSGEMTSAGWGVLAFIVIMFLVLIAAAIFFFIFWIVMLIDAFQRTNWQDDNQKNLWLIALIVSFFFSMSWLAAILYYFIIRKPLGKAVPTAKVVDPPSSAKKK